jgi:putative CocE/NonD family hydrolase
MMRLFGATKVEVYMATSAAQADLAAKLVCVRPSGEAIFLAIGIARSTTLFSRYVADETHLWTFEIPPTDCLLHAGDRVRVEIASCAYPLYDRNPSTDVAARLADSWNWARSTQRIYHDAAHASCVRLPIVEEAI